jgi:hypothetical protein
MRRWAFAILLLSACGDPASNEQEDASSSSADRVDPGDASIDDGEAHPDATSSDDTTAPRFAGIAALYSASTTELRATWMEARDDLTAPANLSYDLYLAIDAATAEANADANMPPTASVTGMTAHTLTGLTAATEYALVVRARDAAGNRSTRLPARTSRTPARDFVAKSTVKDLSALGLTITPTSLDNFDVTGDLSQLAVGDLVIAENEYGRSLRKIVSLTASSMVAVKADLQEVVQSGEMRISGVLPDPTGFGPGTAQGAYYRDPQNNLSIQQTKQNRVFLGPPFRAHESENGVSLEEDVEMDYAFTWEVGYESNVEWFDEGLGIPESMSVIFDGALGVEGSISYALTAEAKYEVEKELVSRTMRFVYTVGAVPVVQEVKLQLMAKMELEAEGEFKAGLEFSAAKTIRVGLVWYNGQGFMPIKDSGFEQETEFTLEGEVSAKAKIKIYPVLSTRLYGVATGKVLVDPTVDVDLHARFLPLPVEIDKTNIDFSVGLQAAADLSIFGKELTKWESDRYELFKLPILSQPEIKLLPPKSANTCHPAKLSLRLANGQNNTVLPQNIYWEVTEGTATISPDPTGLRADLESSTTGTVSVRVRAYGDGPLGLLGQRYAEVSVHFVEPAEDCSMVPPAAAEPIACLPIRSGYTGAPHFAKTRVHSDEALVEAFFPIRVDDVSPRYIDFVVFKDIGNPNYYQQMQQQAFATRVEPGFDGEWLSGLSPSGFGPGRYTLATSMQQSEFDNGCTFTPGFYADCQALGVAPVSTNYYEITAAFGPDREDNDVCKGYGGIPIPWVEVVGPGPDQDNDDDAIHAIDFAHGQRASGKLQPGDKDFIRYQGDPVDNNVYDTDRPEEGCDVEVSAEGTPPVLITIYEGEENAGNEGPSVVEGQTRVRFTPNPSKVYFSRLKYRDETAQGEYVAEIKSDCTQETPFPLLADVPTSNAMMSASYGDVLRFTLPVNALVKQVQVTLREAIPGSTWGAGVNYLDVPAGSTEVELDVMVWNGGFPDGLYYAEITTSDAENNSVTLLSTYGRDASVSTTNYALKKENFIAGTVEIADSTYPMILVDVGPP